MGIELPYCGVLDKESNESKIPSLEQLQMVLNHCNDTSEVKLSIGLEYFNNTHYINNSFCEWQKIEKYPNTDIDCIPNQEKWVTDEEIRNDTHIYNKYRCEWAVEFSWHDEYTRATIDNIRIHGNNDNGATPSLLKYCLSGGISDGFTINNSTHYFDFETCKWKENEN